MKSFTITEAAAHLGTSRQGVFYWIDRLAIEPRRVPAPNRYGFYVTLTQAQVERIERARRK